jgi:glycerophosphoryl diester phosphodiesterase
MHAPENTMDAFELALRQGANVLELDVHLTRDREVIVMHDPTLDRTTNGTGPVRDKTYAEIAELDAGHKFMNRGGRAVFRDRGVEVPRLRDVLQAFPRAGFNIELKAAGMVEPTLLLLDRLKPENLVLTAGADAIMREIEATKPSFALGMSGSQCRAMVDGAKKGKAPEELRGRAAQVPPRYWLKRIVTKRFVEVAHEGGVEVHVWTINDPRKAASLLALGIDGIMSDDPGALVDVVRHRG